MDNELKEIVGKIVKIKERHDGKLYFFCLTCGAEITEIGSSQVQEVVYDLYIQSDNELEFVNKECGEIVGENLLISRSCGHKIETWQIDTEDVAIAMLKEINKNNGGETE